MKRPWPGILLLGALLLGCGTQERVVVVIQSKEPAATVVPRATRPPLRAPLPSLQPPLPAGTRVPVTPPVTVSPPTMVPTPAGTRVAVALPLPPIPQRPVTVPPAGPSDEGLRGGPFMVRVSYPGDFEPLVHCEVRASDGRLLVKDLVSKEGYGRRLGLKFLPAGRYNLKLFCEPTPDYPIYHKNVTIFEGVNPVFPLGQISFRLPEKGLWQVERGITVEIVDAVTARPVFKGLFKDMVALSVYRDRFPRSLILPYGRYAFGLADVKDDDEVKIRTADGSKGLVKIDYENNVFELTEEAPFGAISLEGIVQFVTGAESP